LPNNNILKLIVISFPLILIIINSISILITSPL